jgi:ketosteroid isomerase-like protein
MTQTANKKTVERYLDGFRTSDHELVQGCLTDDVEWVIPGIFHVVGKEAFDGQIENAAFVGRPAITLHRLVEEDDVVVAEGAVRAVRAEGGFLESVFCDVFVMRGGKIARLTTYLAEV